MADLLLPCSDVNIRWIFLFGSYIPRHRLESVIAKYSKHPHRCGDWQLLIHLKTLDSSTLQPWRSTTHTSKIIPHTAAIPGFQTEMATKRQNLRTAALNKKLNFWMVVYIQYFFEKHFKKMEHKVYSIIMLPLIYFSPAIKMIAAGPAVMPCGGWGFVRFIIYSFFSDTGVIILKQSLKGHWWKWQSHNAVPFPVEDNGYVKLNWS